MRRSAALLLLFAPLASAQEKVATVEGVTEYRLANGARLVLYPEPSRPTVTVNMTVLVGSRHEGYGETGMAHLLEHLVFKGTPTFPNVPKALQDHGASFNGTTNVDRTNYFETLPASDKNLEFGIELESDRLVNSFVRREDLVSEFTVVRNEFERGENSAPGILSQRIHAAAYEWHNYGKSTIGNRSDIERVPIDNLKAFYKRFYQPDNCVLIVTGRFEEKKAVELAQKYLGALPKPSRTLDKTYTEEPAQDGERTVTLRRVGTVGAVGAAYHIPAATHPDWAPLSLLGGLVSQSPNGRLYQALVESKLATSAFARADTYHDPGLFSASAECEADKLEATKDALLKTLETLGTKEFTADEVEKAKARSKRQAEEMPANASMMAQALSSSSALGDWRLLFVMRDRTAAVTAADVNRVAKTYFKQPNRTVGVFVPEKQPTRLAIPPTPEAIEVVKGYKGGAVKETGEAFDPTPANLQARLKTTEVGGIKVGVLPKKNRGETVSLALTLHYGNEESLKGQTTAAGLMPMLMMAGTQKHDRQALREELESLGVRIMPGGGGGGRGGPRGRGGPGGGGLGQLSFSVEAKRATLPKALTLLAEILREPAFPAAEFDTMKRALRSGLAGSATDPQALAANKLSRALSPYGPNDVRYVPTLEENLKRIDDLTLEQVKTLYKQQLGASKGELAIVGEFDPDATLAQIKELLAGWTAPVPVQRVERKAGDAAGSKTDINTPDKANAVFLAGMQFPLTDADPDYPALRIGNFLLGGGTLSSRLGDRIRQKEGLSYGVTSSLTASSRDPSASFGITAITNPANMEKLNKAADEELTRFLSEGPSLGELEDAKRAFLEAQKVGRTGDGAIAGQIAGHLDLGRSFAFEQEMEAKIAALTPAQVKAAFQKHIDPKKLVVVRAGDFQK